MGLGLLGVLAPTIWHPFLVIDSVDGRANLAGTAKISNPPREILSRPDSKSRTSITDDSTPMASKVSNWELICFDTRQ